MTLLTIIFILEITIYTYAVCDESNCSFESEYEKVLDYNHLVHFHYKPFGSSNVYSKSLNQGKGVDIDTYWVFIESDKLNSIGFIRIGDNSTGYIYPSPANFKYTGTPPPEDKYEIVELKDFYNNKYYSTYYYNGLSKERCETIELKYTNGFDYILNCNDDEIKSLLNDLAKWIIGGKIGNPPNGIVIENNFVVDLEPPLNVKLDGLTADFLENKSPLKINWEQSNIDLTGWETEFYVKQFGRCKKTIFNEWKDYQSSWKLHKTLTTAEYVSSQYRYYEWKWYDEWSKKLSQTAILSVLYDGKEGGYVDEVFTPDFKIRNKYTDFSGKIHYSRFIYVKCKKDGTYSISELDNSVTDKDDDEIIAPDQNYYNPDNVLKEDDWLSNGNTSFFSILKDMVRNIQNLPDFMSKMFSFLPNWIIGFIATVIGFIVLLRILGR